MKLKESVEVRKTGTKIYMVVKDLKSVVEINVEYVCIYSFHVILFFSKDSGFNDALTHCGPGGFNEISEEYFSSQWQWLMTEIPAVKFPLEECH